MNPALIIGKQVMASKSKIRYRGKKQPETAKPENDPGGYPAYPPDEDIYVQYKEESEINPEEPDKEKVFNTHDDASDADNQELSGKDLDIPGAELDDDMEGIGSEDEENNYYSLGDDSKENQEDNKD